MKQKDFLPFYIGQKIELGQNRFSEDQVDRVFTLDGVTETEFLIKETEIWYEIIDCHGGVPNDRLLLKRMPEQFKQDLKNSDNIPNKVLSLTKEGYDVFDLIDKKIAVDEEKITEKLSTFKKLEQFKKVVEETEAHYLKLENE